MSSFTLTDHGVQDDDTKRLIIDQPLEVVRYSERDDTLYLQWPSGTSFYHMAAIPRRFLDESESIDALLDRCRSIGLAVSDGMEQALRAYLNKAAAPFLQEA